MRELYLLGCLVLGSGAVLATMSVVKYDYQETKQIPKDISFITPYEEEVEEKPLVNMNTEVIYARDAFDASRGKEEKVVETPTIVGSDPGQYSFELRGINIIGKKKVALLTAQPIRKSKSSSSRSRSSSSRSTSPVTSGSSKVLIVAEGEEIDETGHTIKSIVAGKVIIVDTKGKEVPPLIFSLASEDSLKRAELAHRNELSRQKAFSKQNQFPTAPKASVNKTTPVSTKPADPKTMTKEQREAEMRKRAENLKAEMKRLKELRDQGSKSKGSDKSKDKNDRK